MKYPQAVHIPSSVSDWLEEQLEARGIESVLYARYILSLLRTHTVDVVCPDDDGDLQLEHLKKEVKGSSGRKRCRKTSADWWRLSQADAEQLKRSAAVECLMSASDQNCEMESLVDELCAKLKEANGEGSDSGESSSSDVGGSAPASAPRPIQQQHGGGKRVTPRELAERYYAAFPPLGRARVQQQATFCWRRAAAAAAASDRSRCGGIAVGAHSWENRFYGKVPMDPHKSRQNHSRQRPHLQRTKSTPVRKSSWDHGPSLIKKPKQQFQSNQQSKKSDSSKNQHKYKSKEKSHETEQCLEEPVAKAEWTTNEDDVNMYEDLPVDIRELLDSPEPQDNTVEIMNMMNVRDDGKRSFIPYGTNIMSSIWSTDRATATLDNIFNSALDAADDHEQALNFQFSSISIDNSDGDADWSDRRRRDDFEDVENEINSFFERESHHAGLFAGDQRWSDDQFQSLPTGDWEREVVEEERRGVEDEKLSRQVAVSLMKINHSKEKSCFREILPKGPNAFKNDAIFNPYIQSNISMFSFTMKSNLPQEKDDLLTSERSHFKPIVERLEHRTQGQYADGATFLISNSLDKVDYKRSESGAMILEMELGQSKKYREYKPEELDSAQELEFILKFSICQNDKACQTEDVMKIGCCGGEAVDMQIDYNSNNASPTSSMASCEEAACSCPSDGCTCGGERSARPDSALSEVVWKYETGKDGCSQCNNNNNNNAAWTCWSGGEDGVEWNSKRLRNIWDGEEVCQTCLNRTTDTNVPAATSSKKKTTETAPLPPPNSRLREDISQDGEQLLSDLRHLQKAYMEEMPQAVEDMLAENEKKMHAEAYLGGYGCFGNTGGLWSFASRLEEDCLIQMSTIPTLRSVTL